MAKFSQIAQRPSISIARDFGAIHCLVTDMFVKVHLLSI